MPHPLDLCGLCGQSGGKGTCRVLWIVKVLHVLSHQCSERRLTESHGQVFTGYTEAISLGDGNKAFYDLCHELQTDRKKYEEREREREIGTEKNKDGERETERDREGGRN